jgi:hypothetical protein
LSVCVWMFAFFELGVVVVWGLVCIFVVILAQSVGRDR